MYASQHGMGTFEKKTAGVCLQHTEIGQNIGDRPPAVINALIFTANFPPP